MNEGKQQRYEVFNHRVVWLAACRNLRVAEAGGRDSKYFALGAMVLTFFAFEGYLNWLGALILPDVWRNERREFGKPPYAGTLGKNRYLREHLGLSSLEEKERPLSTALMLQKVRNFLAHPRPERGIRDVQFSFPGSPPTYEGFLDECITPAAARRSQEDILELANQLHVESRCKYADRILERKPFGGFLESQITSI